MFRIIAQPSPGCGECFVRRIAAARSGTERLADSLVRDSPGCFSFGFPRPAASAGFHPYVPGFARASGGRKKTFGPAWEAEGR